jgi:hypothetical protein
MLSVRLVMVFASSLGLGAGLAQTQSGKELPKAVSVTGCLVKGDEPKEVWLAQKDGRIYGLENSKIESSEQLHRGTFHFVFSTRRHFFCSDWHTPNERPAYH